MGLMDMLTQAVSGGGGTQQFGQVAENAPSDVLAKGLSAAFASDQTPAIGNCGPRQDMHQGRFAGPVVADETETLALPDHQVDAVDCADGAEMLFDAVQFDQFRVRNDHSSLQIMTAARSPFRHSHHFMLALMAAIDSSLVYSWLATPPLVMLGSSDSKLSCVKAR